MLQAKLAITVLLSLSSSCHVSPFFILPLIWTVSNLTAMINTEFKTYIVCAHISFAPFLWVWGLV